MNSYKIFTILTLIFFLVGCGEKPKSVETKVLSDTITTKLKDTDSQPNKTVDINKLKITDCNLDFSDFFNLFSSDTLFQKSRVKIPFKSSYIEDLETGTKNVQIVESIDKYPFKDFTKDNEAHNRKYDKYKTEIKQIDNNTVHYYHIGIDNGIYINHIFKKENNCWLFVEILDKSS